MRFKPTVVLTPSMANNAWGLGDSMASPWGGSSRLSSGTQRSMLENWEGGFRGFRVTNNFYAKYDILKSLSVKSSWSNDRNSGHDTYYYSPLLAQGYPDGAAESAVGISSRFTT